jgi:hypothetical protein
VISIAQVCKMYCVVGSTSIFRGRDGVSREVLRARSGVVQWGSGDE